MTNQKHAGLSAIGTAALCAVLTACGQGSTPGTAVSGSAVSDGPILGAVTLVDASSPAQQRTVSTTSSGAFVLDAKGTQGPYLLQVSGRDRAGSVTLYGISDGKQSLDVNPLTDAAYAAAAGDKTSDQAFRDGSEDGRARVASGTVNLLNQLKTVLAPLLQLYGIVDPFKDTAQVKLLLTDVAFRTAGGALTVSNRATGGVVYQAPLKSIAIGTFHPEYMPAGACATAAAGDGAALYAASCQGCHGPLATSQVKGKSLSEINGAIGENEGGMGKLTSLTTAQRSAIAAALSGATTTCGGTACTYAYGEWSACANGTQARDVTSATPAACTGTPMVSQTCTAAPTPAVACTSYQYGAYGACVNGSQSRTVTAGSPAGCTDQTTTPPVLTQSCTVAPTACTGYTFSAWGTCSAAGTQGRTVVSAIPSGCDQTTSPPVLSQTCAPPCTSYGYGAWSTCSAAGSQTRAVTSTVPATCDQASSPPVLSQSCTPAPAACTGFNYSGWGACSASGSQTRTVSSYTPTSCTGTPTATPVLSQSCTPAPAACTGFNYSAWGTCSAAGQQTRTVSSYTPTSCTGTPTATPVLSQSCTPACTSYNYGAWGTCSAAGSQTRTVTSTVPATCSQTSNPPVTSQSCTPPVTCTLATAVASCNSCHGGSNTYPSGHTGRPKTCASCHTSITATATPSGTACVLSYPTGTGTHGNGTVNF